MANYAALIDVLSIAGSRLSDGSVNASGKVWFFQVGTNTPANVYSNASATTIVTQPVTLTSGGLLNTSDLPNGIYVTQPVRVYIEDVNGTSVADMTYVPATAGDVGVSNAGFTDSTLDGVLTKAFTSFGGQDWKYKESSGATARTVAAKFAEIWISVKDFGAVGDGVAIDTTAIQNAMNRVKALGGGVCYFPPGTYLIDQALSLTSATGVRVVGAGSRAVIIATSHASADTFLFTGCTACAIENLRIAPSVANSGNGIELSGATVDFVINGLTMKSNHDVGILIGGTSNAYVTGSSIVGVVEDVYISGTNKPTVFAYSSFAGATKGLSLALNAQDVYVTNSWFFGTTGVEFVNGLTGTRFEFVGNPTLGTCSTPLSIGTTELPVYRQWGNGIDASSTSGATGGTQTPVLYKGNEVLLTAASGGAGTVTVASPAILPGTSATDVNLYWDFVLKGAAGGNATFDFNAVFKITGGGTTIVVTDGHQTAVRFRWDRVTSKLREVSRADTVT